MKVSINCSTCGGFGMVNKCGENSAWSEKCPDCNGFGTQLIPFTNADRIKSMNDGDLANLIYDAYWDGYHEGATFTMGDARPMSFKSKIDEIQKWLSEEV